MWRGGKKISRKGTEIEYNGKKYISIKELCRELDIPYSQTIHKFNRTQDVEESVAWAKKSQEEDRHYELWNKKYESLCDVAKTFGLNTGSLRNRLAEGKSLEETVHTMLQRESIDFGGKEYMGISSLAVAYGHDASIIFDRLMYGMSMENALFQPIRKIDRPELAIEYRGKRYDSKRHLARELGISSGCIHEMLVNNDVDFETAVDILWETKERCGIPKSKMISGIPACIIRGKVYESARELIHELGFSTETIYTYKHRHECKGILDTLCAMQGETKYGYVLDGKIRTYQELLDMGYTSTSYRKLPKETVPRYPQLAGFDFIHGCVDVMKIYAEVKEEMLNQQQGMQMNM